MIDIPGTFGKAPQAEVEVVKPPAPSMSVSPKTAAVLADMDRSDNTLQKLGWAGIGVPDRTVRLMESMEEFVRGKIRSTIDATHGSMLRASASALTRMVDLETDMERIQSKYRAGGASEGADMGMEDLAKIQMLHDQWVDCVKIQKDCNAAATQAAHTRAMIEAKVRELEGKKRGTKPKLKRVSTVVRHPVPTGTPR